MVECPLLTTEIWSEKTGLGAFATIFNRNFKIQDNETGNDQTNPWSSLVEGDEQLDRPNSQIFMEL